VSIEEDVANDGVLFDIYSLQSAVNYPVEGSVNPEPIDFRVWDPPRARLPGQQTLSPQALTCQTVKYRNGQLASRSRETVMDEGAIGWQ
jgi:hypothetical protein